MGNTGSKNKFTAQENAILEIKFQRDEVHRYKRRITQLTARETEIARTCLAQNNKSGALLALRRKKYQETLLSRTDAQLSQLQQLISDIEFAKVQTTVLEGIRQGTQVLKEIHKEMGGIERVELIMEDSQEAQRYQKEIGDLLAGQMSNEDEDEVEDELEAMEKEIAAKDIANSLPDAPVTSPEERERVRAEERKKRAKERAAERQRPNEPMLAQ